MKLDKINITINQYLEDIQAFEDLSRIARMTDQFAREWSFESENFLRMFDLAIDKDIYNIFYPGRQLPFKAVMLEMIKRNPIAIKQMFLDLFYDRVDILSRVEHFIMECDENFKNLSQEIRAPFSHHLHNEFKTISIYLFLHNHEKYGFLDHTEIVKYLKFVEARNIPDIFDFENQLKSLNILANIALMNRGIKDILTKFEFDFSRSLIIPSEIIRNFKY